MSSNIYLHKCVVDDGIAPVHRPQPLSITVGKPKIRTSAKVGNIVIAFGESLSS